MKVTTLILAVVCAASFSSCCCQSEPVPPLRPMPKDCGQPQEIISTPMVPTKVIPVKNGK